MHRRMLIAMVGLLAIGIAGSAGAATLDFTGTLGLKLTDSPAFPVLGIPGGGSAQLTDDGSFHLLSLTIPGQAFGPITTTLPVAIPSINSLWFTDIQNLAGSFSAISGGPPGGGSMGLQGVAKICLQFASCLYSNATIPLTPTAGGGVGFGIGGTQTWIPSSPARAVTMQHSPWTIGQPTMTLHTPNTTVWVPTLPGGFAHGPASLTSSTARPGGAVQLVTASKVFSNLVGPEMPISAALTLYFVPEPGTLLLLASGVVVLAIYGHRNRGG